MDILKRFFGNGALINVKSDVLCLQDKIVNIYLIGEPKSGSSNWVLVDAGMFNVSNKIRKAAAARFSPGSRPLCIILTHGHFDHVGAVKTLAEEWNVPVYAHTLEMPYLTGAASYPPPDPTVGGGFMAWSSFIFPKKPIDISGYIKILPSDGSIPGLSGWRWIHTLGHSPGHISLYREYDKLLIAGDAIVTTKQESFISALTQKKEVRRPPAYFTPDWNSAHNSVKRIADLDPDVIATGHGLPMSGNDMKVQLRMLADDFPNIGVPETGKYAKEYVPQPVTR